MSTMYNDNHVDMLYNIDLYNIYRPVCHVDANGVLGCGWVGGGGGGNKE